ncbi:hypothetical protein FIBSPDRAFT_930333 [Athelia psychrophila]|uniref:Uncharacterized protein n=1 Tax=Athelia psychrophila TaxID=1759441 RepID=A0A166MC74_9AGAM|nr:hypothetical protein FIBSPDRAFT_930333 [Fibularhizoctonia sp. CBS 109695]
MYHLPPYNWLIPQQVFRFSVDKLSLPSEYPARRGSVERRRIGDSKRKHDAREKAKQMRRQEARRLCGRNGLFRSQNVINSRAALSEGERNINVVSKRRFAVFDACTSTCCSMFVYRKAEAVRALRQPGVLPTRASRGAPVGGAASAPNYIECMGGGGHASPQQAHYRSSVVIWVS